MALPLSPSVEPMLSQLEDDVPEGEGWLYEPKWDGFRAIVFRDGDSVHLQSREGKPLERYFPELPPALRTALPERCVVDGEIVLPGPRGLDFDALQQRIHPAASRIEKLSQETPASFVAFDLLALNDQDMRGEPLIARRAALERALTQGPHVFITPQTTSAAKARRWFVEFEGAGMDGVVAKRADLRYQPGARVMVKVKHERTVDCVVGGYRLHKQGGVGSLLLGLHDDQGVLHHVGHTSSFSAKERKQLLERLQPLEGGKSFGEGRTPGEPSRWTSGRDMSWTPLTPSLVVEVSFDYLQGDRFRHAARLLRWRVDKAPERCTFDQIKLPEHFSLEEVVKLAPD
jgi:ATP-dependent DNA ligase